jgi:purine-binding chemotaxis protein CheW
MNETNQYLSFRLGSDAYALGVDTVREILDDKRITPVPRVPEFLRGVINVRGMAVPVVDLRLKLGMSRTVLDTNTCVIIAEVRAANEVLSLGVLADSVQEVLELDQQAMTPPPSIGTAVDSRSIAGMARVEDVYVTVLDVNSLFTLEELSAAGGMKEAAPE